MLEPVPHDDYSHIINDNNATHLLILLLIVVLLDLKAVKYLKVHLFQQPIAYGKRASAFSQVREAIGSPSISSPSIDRYLCVSYGDG